MNIETGLSHLYNVSETYSCWGIRILRLFLFFWIMMYVNTHVLQINFCRSIHRNVITGHIVNCVSIFNRNGQMLFREAISFSLTKGKTVVLYPCYHLILLIIFILATLEGITMALIMVLICISLLTNNVEQLLLPFQTFMCFIWWRVFCSSLVLIFTNWSCCISVEYWRAFYIFQLKFFCQMWDLQILFPNLLLPVTFKNSLSNTISQKFISYFFSPVFCNL